MGDPPPVTFGKRGKYAPENCPADAPVARSAIRERPIQLAMFNCHCRDCQRASGGAYAPVVRVPKAAIRINGEPSYHRLIADSGLGIERGFCPNCGSQVLLLGRHNPDNLILQAGCLDDPSIYRPARDIFTASAQPWDHMGPVHPKVRDNILREPCLALRPALEVGAPQRFMVSRECNQRSAKVGIARSALSDWQTSQ